MPKKLGIRNIIFISAVFIILVVIALSAQTAASINKVYKQDHNNMQTVKSLVNNKKYQKAEEILLELEKKYPGSYEIKWNLGLCYSGLKNPEKAREYLVRARELAPMLVTMDNYLIQYGETAFTLKQYDTAKAYFERLKMITTDENYIKKVDAVLEQISEIQKIRG